MGVLTNKNNSLITMNKIYKFKIFKKTTKFKRYNRGLTRFIINRKKYILRKKRTNYQLMLNLSFFWSKFYMTLRHINRYSQLLGSLNYSLTLSDVQFTNKSFKKYLNSASSNDYKPAYASSSSKRAFLLNRSLYIPKNIQGPGVFHKQSRIGFLLFNKEPDKLDDILNAGVLVDSSGTYASSLKNEDHFSKKNYLFIQKRLFLSTLRSVQIMRKLLIIITLRRVATITNSKI